MTVLAIDQGTTGTSGMVLGDGGDARVVTTIDHKQFYPSPGWVEHDPDELMANVQACIAAAEDVAAIGIDNQGESCLAWNANTKEAVSPVIVWQDNRTQSVVEALKSDGNEAMILEKSGLPLDSYFSASKLAWIVDNIPDAARLHAQGNLRLGTTDAFFLDRLTGVFATDITTASRTSLMNLATGSWDAELCELFGVPIEALPPIVPTTGDFGAVRRQGRSIPVTASVVDQQAALYGHGCRQAGDSKITFGTGAFALVITGHELHRAPDKGLLPTVAWQRDGETPVYAMDGGVYCASSAVNWAKGLGLFEHFYEINTFDQPPAILRNLAFVPALTGLACPHWDRNAVGLWIGMSLDVSARDMVQALLEGIAFRAAEVIDAMNEHIPLGDTISVDGGMSVNGYFCQFLADAVGRTVTVPRFGELTALGTGRLASGQEGTEPSSEHDVYRPRRDLSEARVRFADAVSSSRQWSAPA